MNESAPKILTRKDVFRSMRKMLTPYTMITHRANPDFAKKVGNTAQLFNLLNDRVSDNLPFPQTWDGLGFNESTDFIFLKERDGQYYKKEQRFENPVAFISAMKNWHGLAELISEEEKRDIAEAQAAAAESHTPEGIRALRLAREAANEAKVASATPTVTPRRPSVFRPKG